MIRSLGLPTTIQPWSTQFGCWGLLSNFDAKLRVQMRLQIKELHLRTGQTTLYATHDQVEAMTLADRLIVMNKGVAEQIATPHEVYTRPESEFVAGFIGSPAMNIFTVRCEGGEAILPGNHRLPVDFRTVTGNLRLGLRPEDLELVDSGVPSIPVVLKTVEWLGADAFGYGVIEGSDEMVTLRLPGKTAAAKGDRLHVAPPEGRLHFFSIETGKRVA